MKWFHKNPNKKDSNEGKNLSPNPILMYNGGG